MDIRLKLNFKAIMMFESITGDNFMEAGPDNMDKLAYAMYCCCPGNEPVTIKEFIGMISSNEKVAKQVTTKIQREMTLIQEMADMMTSKETGEEVEDTGKETGEDPIHLSDLAAYLIITQHLDPRWVLNDMELWMVGPLMNQIDKKQKNEMVEKRFWSFLQVAPHISTKKIKGPEDFLPFEWEAKNKKTNAEKELEDITPSISAFLKNQNKEKNNG